MAMLRCGRDPEAPWERYADRSIASSFWRQGSGQAYLELTFVAWWRTIGVEKRIAYMAAHHAPEEWRVLFLSKAWTSDSSDD